MLCENSDLALRLRACASWYDFLASIFEFGVTPAVQTTIESISELSDVLNAKGEFDWDQHAADHFDVFGMNVFAMESTFRIKSMAEHQALLASLATFYRHIEFGPSSSVSHDHIATELSFLSQLIARTLTPQPQDAQFMLDTQRRFLMQHVTVWAPGLACAIEQEGHHFFSMIGSLLIQTLEQHLQLCSASPSLTPEQNHSPCKSTMHGMGLSELVEYLNLPAQSGLYISQGQVRQLAQELNLPCGFGSRRMILKTLFESAGRFSLTNELIKKLMDLGYRQCEFLGQIDSHWFPEVPLQMDRLLKTMSNLNKGLQEGADLEVTSSLR